MRPGHLEHSSKTYVAWDESLIRPRRFSTFEGFSTSMSPGQLEHSSKTYVVWDESLIRPRRFRAFCAYMGLSCEIFCDAHLKQYRIQRLVLLDFVNGYVPSNHADCVNSTVRSNGVVDVISLHYYK